MEDANAPALVEDPDIEKLLLGKSAQDDAELNKREFHLGSDAAGLGLLAYALERFLEHSVLETEMAKEASLNPLDHTHKEA